MSLAAKIQEDYAADTSIGTYLDASGLSFSADECADIKAIADIRCGTELYSTDGELSNPSLMARYGFRVLHDVVHLPRRLADCVTGGQGSCRDYAGGSRPV